MNGNDDSSLRCTRPSPAIDGALLVPTSYGQHHSSLPRTAFPSPNSLYVIPPITPVTSHVVTELFEVDVFGLNLSYTRVENTLPIGGVGGLPVHSKVDRDGKHKHRHIISGKDPKVKR